MTKRLTDLEIKARIVPTSLRWPSVEVAKNRTWDKLRDGVDLLRGMMHALDLACRAIEDDVELNPNGIANRRTELGQKAYAELKSWPPLQAAEAAVATNLTYLEGKMVDLPSPPVEVADVSMARELREHIKRQERPLDFVLKNMDDKDVLGAVLCAKPYLSGLSETEWNLVRQRARSTAHPIQAKEQEALTKALSDLREGVEAGKRLVLERCDLRLDADGQVRPIRSPLPTSQLAEARAATKPRPAPVAAE